MEWPPAVIGAGSKDAVTPARQSVDQLIRKPVANPGGSSAPDTDPGPGAARARPAPRREPALVSPLLLCMSSVGMPLEFGHAYTAPRPAPTLTGVPPDQAA